MSAQTPSAIDQAMDALQARYFSVYRCKTGREAAQLALSLIPRDHLVSWGGSATIDAIGIKDLLREAGYRLLDRDTAATPQERVQLMRQSLLCDTFLTSANAVSQDGWLVNIDGNGNRVAAMAYGPESVIVVVGSNKLAPTLAQAQDRKTPSGFPSPPPARKPAPAVTVSAGTPSAASF